MLLFVTFLLEILKKFIAFFVQIWLFNHGSTYFMISARLPIWAFLLADTYKHFPYRVNRYIGQYRYRLWYRLLPGKMNDIFDYLLIYTISILLSGMIFQACVNVWYVSELLAMFFTNFPKISEGININRLILIVCFILKIKVSFT